MSNEDRTLADDPTEAPRDDALSGADPETFDFAAFVAGVRRTRRAVTIYARGDLLAERDILTARIDEALSSGAPNKTLRELEKQRSEVSQTLKASSIDLIMEARSKDWYKDRNAEIEELMSTNRDTDPSVPLNVERNCRIVAAQTVAPQGVTGEELIKLWKISPTQVDRLVARALEVSNSDPGESPDFSHAASGSPRTAR